ncbi:phage tail protein [Portibacter lacus]|uniref:Microcystin dependent MdpB family protein n=1 Tax=Portibacter lacus TaxID=1099794 RepID=A0AA37WBZ1_9BACT|nr:tail fiber protein [Portibacter lacus]GLR15568.1 microcystin dependent MdpB family protein [Portibacter lacus]
MNLKNALIVFILVSANITTLSFINLEHKKEELPEITLSEQRFANEESFSNDPFIGEIVLFAGNFAPRGWAFCDGQLLSIPSNSALFSILGTTYGGDGETTFGLPDLRGRVAVGQGSGPGLNHISLGQKLGENETSLNINNLPSHSHQVSAKLYLGDGLATSSIGEGNHLAVNTGTTPIYTDNINTTVNSAENLDISISTEGNNQAFSNMQPGLGLNYIIALFGTYPSSN